MTPTKLLIGQILIVFAIVCALAWLAMALFAMLFGAGVAILFELGGTTPREPISIDEVHQHYLLPVTSTDGHPSSPGTWWPGGAAAKPRRRPRLSGAAGQACAR